MATLKEILGENYRDGMTLAEIETALNGKNLADLSSGDYVSKAKYTSLEQKANAAEKRLNETLSDEEKRAKEIQDREEYYKKVEQENAVYKYTEKLSSTIADADLRRKIATCYASGDLENALALQNEYYSKQAGEIEKRIKEDLLKKQPQPAAQTQNLGKSFKEMTLDERAQLHKNDPEKYNQLKNQN